MHGNGLDWSGSFRENNSAGSIGSSFRKETQGVLTSTSAQRERMPSSFSLFFFSSSSILFLVSLSAALRLTISLSLCAASACESFSCCLRSDISPDFWQTCKWNTPGINRCPHSSFPLCVVPYKQARFHYSPTSSALLEHKTWFPQLQACFFVFCAHKLIRHTQYSLTFQ